MKPVYQLATDQLREAFTGTTVKPEDVLWYAVLADLAERIDRVTALADKLATENGEQNCNIYNLNDAMETTGLRIKRVEDRFDARRKARKTDDPVTFPGPVYEEMITLLGRAWSLADPPFERRRVYRTTVKEIADLLLKLVLLIDSNLPEVEEEAS